MSTPQFIVDANAENFNKRVLENSRNGPVLVNYWSPHAGPCLKLWPTLQNLANEYAGRFLLVNINTDTQKQLTKQQGINSVPTVKLFINEQVKAQVHGAESEQSFRKLLNEYLPLATHPAIATAIVAYKQNDHEIAFKLLKDAITLEPENTTIPLTLIKLYLRENLHSEINTLYEQLPKTIQQKNEFINIKTHSHFMQIASTAKELTQLNEGIKNTPNNPEILEQLAAISLVKDDYENTFKYLLKILKHQPDYKNNIASQGLITIFELLGQQHPLTKQYRKEMQLILE